MALLGVSIALGAGAMWLAGQVEPWLLSLWGGGGPLRLSAVAALSEELLKLLVVTAVALAARREFDDPMDGIVYGSMAGLGAALEESVFYSRLEPAAQAFVPAAELVRLWAHVVLGGIVGFPLGYWRAFPRSAAAAAFIAFGVAAGLHFAWDLVVLSMPAASAARPPTWHTPTGALLMLGSLLLYGRLVVVASSRSRQQLAPRSPLRLWGWPFDGRRRPPA